MMKNISARLAMLVVAVLIVLPVNSSVKHLSSNRVGAVSVAMLSGSPLPMPPTPPRSILLIASGSPLPMPPTPPRSILLSASGSPLPMPPTPPGRMA